MSLSEPSHSTTEPVNCDAPPVTEVVIGIQFDRPVVDLEVLAEFTARVKSEFPKRQQQPPLPRLSEDLSTPPTGPTFQFELSTDYTLPRSLFMTDEEDRTVQVQADRFIFNWRRPTPDHTEYPRFRQLRGQFRGRLGDLVTSIEGAGGQVPSVNLCEVTYVNQIRIPDVDQGDQHPGLFRVLKSVASPDYELLPPPEDSQLQARFRIEPDSGEGPKGRLYVNAGPAFRSDGLPVYVLNLTTRLVPASDDADGMWSAIEVGHDWIVRGFADLTTDEMHQAWGLQLAEGAE